MTSSSCLKKRIIDHDKKRKNENVESKDDDDKTKCEGSPQYGSNIIIQLYQDVSAEKSDISSFYVGKNSF